MILKIMTWNIKGGASLVWNNQYEIKSKVVDKIIEQKANIIVLTEFVIAKGLDYLFERFQNEGYICFITNRSGKNGILIGISRVLVDETILVDKVYSGDMISSVDEGCNILRVKVPLQCGKNLSIIGCRMETGGTKVSQTEYDAERKCFDSILIPMIQAPLKEHNYIVCGDFNNAYCRGKLNEKFKPENYEGRVQVNYNLNIIKDKFDSMGFTMADVTKDGFFIPTHNGYPLDHIFMHGLCTKCETVKADGLSDHDILIAEYTTPIE